MLQDRPEFTYPSYMVTVSEVGGTFSVQLPATANRDGGILTVNTVGLTAGTEYNVNIQGVTSLGQLEDQVTFNEFTSKIMISMLVLSINESSYIPNFFRPTTCFNVTGKACVYCILICLIK